MTQQQNAAPTALAPIDERRLAMRENMAGGDPIAIVPRTFAEAMEFAKVICSSSLVPQALRDNAPNTMMMICAGAEIRIPPIASMRVFHVIEGVPKLSADGIAAICSRDPSCEYLEPRELSATRVTWAAKKPGRPEIVLTVTREEMIAAGLYDRKNRDGSPGNHQKYPRQMLNARCKAELCRIVWPHICAGMLSTEEYADEHGLDVGALDAQFTERRSDGLAPLPTARPATPRGAPLAVDLDSDFARGATNTTSYAKTVADDDAAPPPPVEIATHNEAPTRDIEIAGPLTDDDVTLIAEDLKRAPDGRARAAIAADIAKMDGKDGRRSMNEAQRRYLLDAYKKAGGSK